MTNVKHNERIKHLTVLFVILISTIFVSCDPPKMLIVKATNDSNSSVIIYANKNFNNKSVIVDTQKLVIKVPTTELSTKRDTSFFFGIGSWSNDVSVIQFSKNIDSISIVSGDKKLLLKSQSEISEYLIKSRRGMFSNILTIEAK